jgi:hypothetical protein
MQDPNPEQEYTLLVERLMGYFAASTQEIVLHSLYLTMGG